MKPLTIALCKGRLEKDFINILEKTGIDCASLRDKGRKLVFDLPGGGFRVVLAKAPDVITYVEHGVCDLGVVGKDTIAEHGSSFYEVMDLGIGRCRFALAARRGADFYGGFGLKRVASKYPNVTRRFFSQKAMDVDVVKIEGSVELAPLLGLSDGIMDIVESGDTLRENGLEVIEFISDISARIIVNIASMKLYKPAIDALLREIERVVE